jgi:hypothetical protein
MKTKMKYLLGIAGVGILLMVAFLPTPPLKDRIEKALDDYLIHFPQEKIYLQMDKDYYASGSTIWFKAYITRDYLPTNLSTILYVELLDKKGKVLQRNKLPVKDGGAWGDFTLSPELRPGDYRIRAYTLWMLNFDPAFLYNKDVHIFEPGNPESTPAPPATPAKTDYAVQFFPEGGDLVDSVESLVAFKAINQEGYPAKVTGILTDNQGHTLDTIHSIHDGMGSFSFMPLPGRSYQAVMKDTSGQTKTFPLPAAKSDGVVLHVIPTGDGKVFFQARRSPKDTARYNKLVLAGQIGGHLVYFADIDFSEGYSGGLIPVDKDPGGIMQMTLFTPEGIPLAERLTFVKNKKNHLQLTLRQDSVSLKPRGKNKFTLIVPDSIQANFSVAVTDADQVKKVPDQDNIVSHLLLTSDLNGNIYNPAWYFSADDSATRRGLELVMLTNGWRRFSWQKVLNQKYPEMKYAPETLGLHVRGEATDRKGPLKNGKISMFLRAPADSLTYFISGATEADGSFAVNNLAFHDTAYLYYKAVDSAHKGRIVTVKFLSNPASQQYALLHHPIHAYLPASDTSLRRYLELAAERNQVDKYINNHSVLLKEVTVTARKIPKEKKTEDRYTTGMFKSDNGYSFDLTGKTLPYTSIFQYLQGRVPGMIISGNPSNPSVRWRGGSPGFFLDEVPVSAEQIGNLSVDDIALVKVYRPPFYGGLGGSNGAIAIYTKRGGDQTFSPGRGFEKLSIPGYTIVRKFYSPDYSVKKRINELPDKRATLYWNPDLATDSASHKLTFSFYNTDITHRMRIIIEGVANNGRIGRIEKVVP